MIDYLELFSQMLDEENGAQKVADYLTNVANSANEARLRKQRKSQKEEAIEEIARIMEDYFGDLKIFTLGNYRPKDAVEAMIEALISLEDLVDSDKSFVEWLKNV